MAEGSVYFGAVAGSYASGLCYANFGYQVRPACKENYLFTFSQAVFFVSCGLNSLGLLYSLVYMSNIKQEKTVTDKGALSRLLKLMQDWGRKYQGRIARYLTY